MNYTEAYTTYMEKQAGVDDVLKALGKGWDNIASWWARRGSQHADDVSKGLTKGQRVQRAANAQKAVQNSGNVVDFIKPEIKATPATVNAVSDGLKASNAAWAKSDALREALLRDAEGRLLRTNDNLYNVEKYIRANNDAYLLHDSLLKTAPQRTIQDVQRAQKIPMVIDAGDGVVHTTHGQLLGERYAQRFGEGAQKRLNFQNGLKNTGKNIVTVGGVVPNLWNGVREHPWKTLGYGSLIGGSVYGGRAAYNYFTPTKPETVQQQVQKAADQNAQKFVGTPDVDYVAKPKIRMVDEE